VGAALPSQVATSPGAPVSSFDALGPPLALNSELIVSTGESRRIDAPAAESASDGPGVRSSDLPPGTQLERVIELIPPSKGDPGISVEIVSSPAPDGLEHGRATTLAAWPAFREPDDSPLERTVHVRIGAIEIHAAPPAPMPVPQAPPAAQPPPPVGHGFEEFTRLRSYAPWTW